MMIHFPAIVRLSGQDELLYISDHTSLQHHYQVQQAYLLPDDLLIDSCGAAYPLVVGIEGKDWPNAVKIFELPELTSLVQAHFFAAAQSCVVKIHAPDIQALFHLLQNTD